MAKRTGSTSKRAKTVSPKARKPFFSTNSFRAGTNSSKETLEAAQPREAFVVTNSTRRSVARSRRARLG